MKYDVIGPWSEIKLEILKKYAQPYSIILSKKRLKHVYIDAFAGSGVHISKSSNRMIPGSPVNALLVDPPFQHHYFIDLDGQKVEFLRQKYGDRPDVTIDQGDCNDILLRKVFPVVKYENFMRGLCFLDPYGLHLSWNVIETAGKMKSIEILLNFPLVDMNRNVLWKKNPAGQKESQIKRMNDFWGDESWRDVVYDDQGDLFHHIEKLPTANIDIAKEFQIRLKKKAGFKYVPDPIPMKHKNKTLYYLFFASHNETGAKILVDIFQKYT